MNNIINLLAIFLAFSFCLIGCGGGGGSSSDVNSVATGNTPQNIPPSSPKSTPPSIPNSREQFVSHSVNPLADFGLETGDKICFRLKSYDNFSESAFSKAICSKIKNETALTLSWNKTTRNINGYYVYFGTNKNNATNFLADIMTES